MKALFTTFFLLLGLCASSQDLHLYFDVHNDTTYYLRNGKSIPRPEVRRGEQIYVHVVNYNNYLYELKLEVEEKKIPMAERTPAGAAAAAGAGSLLSMFIAPGGGMPMGGLPFLSGIDGSQRLGFAGKEEALDEALRQKIQGMHDQLERNIRQVRKTDSALSALEEEMATQLAAVKLEQFAAGELGRIRYDPGLEPARIQEMAREYAEILFGDTDPAKLTLGRIRERVSPYQQLEMDFRSYKARIIELDSLQQKNIALKSDLLHLGPMPGTNLAEVLDVAQNHIEVAGRRLIELRTQEQALQSALSVTPPLDTERLVALRTLYIILMENTFSKSYRYEASGDLMTVSVKLLAVDSLRHQGAHNRELPPVTVRVYGGLRMTTSVGLGFSQYFQRPNTYFIRDSTVQSSRKDAFVPQLSSFLHFYYPRPGKISWGGSIGAGMPLSGGEGLQSLAFFMGPSLVIGQNSRIILSTGLMGGRVARPSQGYQTGDRFPSDPSLFVTESAYQLGYFFSASFNLIGS